MNGPVPPDDDIPADLAAAFPHMGPGPADGPGTGDDAGTSAPSLGDMRAALEAETGPRWSAAEASTTARWAMALTLVGVACAVVLAASRRVDLGVYPTGRLVLDLALVLLPVLLGLGSALRPLSRPQPSGRARALAALAGGAGVIALLSLPVAHSAHPASLAGAGEDLVSRAASCFAYGATFAGLTLLGFRALTRHREGWWPGSAMLGAAGGVGLLALLLHCPITHTAHLWAGHGTVAALFGVGVLWLRRRLDG